MTPRQRLRTVAVFTKLNTKRFFRDKVALFFGILFPLIFLFVFGGISSGNNSPKFHVALLNESQTAYAKSFNKQLSAGKIFKIDSSVHTLAEAKDKLSKSQIDGIIVLPQRFWRA